MMWDQDTGAYAPWEGQNGADYLTLVDVQVSDIAGLPEGYLLTWTFTLKTNWQETDSGIKFEVYAEDDDGLGDGWNYDNSSTLFNPAPSIRLSVPHYYQGDTGWCGPTTLSMLLEYYGIDCKPWIVAEYFGLGQEEGITPNQFSNYLQEGVGVEYWTGQATSRLAGMPFPLGISSVNRYITEKISEGNPVVISTDEEIRHFFIVVGFDSENVYINDPSGVCFDVLGRKADPGAPDYVDCHGYVCQYVTWDDFNKELLGGSWGLDFPFVYVHAWSIDDDTLTVVSPEKAGSISVLSYKGSDLCPYSSFFAGSHLDSSGWTNGIKMEWDGADPHEGYYYDSYLAAPRDLHTTLGAKFTREDNLSLNVIVSNPDLVSRNFNIDVRLQDSDGNDVIGPHFFDNIHVDSMKCNVSVQLFGNPDNTWPAIEANIESGIIGEDDDGDGLIDENITPKEVELSTLIDGEYTLVARLINESNEVDRVFFRFFVEGGAVADPIPPIPNPMTWSTQPNAASATSIAMLATTASDADSPPVSYYFDFIDSPTGGSGGTDSIWQSSTIYIDTGLQPNNQYGYKVKARDSAPTPNETTPSIPVAYVYTHANTPGTAAFSNVTQAAMRANWTANGNRAGTEYFCQNITNKVRLCEERTTI